MRTQLFVTLILFIALFTTSWQSRATSSDVWHSLVEFTSKFPNRVAGTKQEQQAAKWLTEQFQHLGYTVEQQPFEFRYPLDKTLTEQRSSRNLQITIPGQSHKTIIIGAHYDAVPSVDGSSGFVDNASGVATLLSLAKTLKQQTPRYTVKLVLFGAEEVGLQGAKYYAAQLHNTDTLVGMINLDTIIGGDNLHIHSAHSTPYRCDYLDTANYSNDPSFRDALLNFALSDQFSPRHSKYRYSLHPETDGYPQGETGGWSDHAPFACLGVPIAYLEATNFNIKGESGYDGYSQTIQPQFWDCFNAEQVSACDHQHESLWGKIWHTKFDQKDYLERYLGSQVQQQLDTQVALLSQFILNNKGKTSQAK